MNSRAARASLRPSIAVAALFILALLLPAAPASAQGTPQQRAACEGDATRLCGEFVPDIERIKACMSRKRAQLSPACRIYFGGGKRKARRR
jgi:hypothetical protein